MRKKILFVSWTSRPHRPYYDPSVRYRCHNPAQALTRYGHGALVVAQSKFDEISAQLNDFDAYVFHRPLLTEKLANFLVNLSPTQTAIADFDDLIFDVRHAALTPMVRVRGAAMPGVQAYLAKTHDATQLLGNISLSTTPLQQHAEALFPGRRTLVLHNAVDPGFIGMSRAIRDVEKHADRPYTLGYFSGTATHNKDFALIAPTLREFLLSQDANLLLAGPVDIPDTLQGLGSRVVTHPLVPFHALPKLMAQCKTVLAPLEDTIFTRSKSGLKFFEAALAGCNVIATPIPDVDRFDSPLLKKCRTESDWSRALAEDDWPTSLERQREIERIEHLVALDPQMKKWIDVFLN